MDKFLKNRCIPSPSEADLPPEIMPDSEESHNNGESIMRRTPRKKRVADPNNPPYPVCGAKKRSKKEDWSNPNSVCCQPAGFGTHHPGVGRCKYHGGATPPKTPTASRSKYAHLLPRYSEIYEKYLEDPDLKNLRPEIAKLRTLVHRFEDEIMESQCNPIEKYKELSSLLERITKAVERLDRIEEGRKYSIKIEEWNHGISAVAQILKEEIVDIKLLDRITFRFRQIAIMSSPDRKVTIEQKEIKPQLEDTCGGIEEWESREEADSDFATLTEPGESLLLEHPVQEGVSNKFLDSTSIERD